MTEEKKKKVGIKKGWQGKRKKRRKMQFIPENPIPENSYFSLLTLKSPSVITRGGREK